MVDSVYWKKHNDKLYASMITYMTFNDINFRQLQQLAMLLLTQDLQMWVENILQTVMKFVLQSWVPIQQKQHAYGQLQRSWLQKIQMQI